MNYSPPTKTTWYVSLALGAVGLIASLVTIPVLTGLAVWLVLIGLGLMLAAARLPNL